MTTIAPCPITDAPDIKGSSNFFTIDVLHRRGNDLLTRNLGFWGYRSDRRIRIGQFDEHFGTFLGDGDECLGGTRGVVTVLLRFLQSAYRNTQKRGEPRLGQAGLMRADTAREMAVSAP